MKEKKQKNENIKLKKGKALVICGPQGSGKTLLAEVIAKKHGTYKVVGAGMLCDRFSASIFTDNPDTVIVDEFIATEESLAVVMPLIKNEKVLVHQQCKSPMEANTPNFIFVTGDKDSIPLDVSERRFMVVEVEPTKGKE